MQARKTTTKAATTRPQTHHRKKSKLTTTAKRSLSTSRHLRNKSTTTSAQVGTSINPTKSAQTTSKRTWLSRDVPHIPYNGPRKSADELMKLWEVTPIRPVPSHIKIPDYAHGRQNGQPSVSPMSRPEIKSDADIARMRHVCEMASYIREFGGKQVRPGITTDEIDQIVHDEIIRLDAYPSPLKYHGFPKSLCTSVNGVICHGIPDKRPLVEGDIINLDITIYFDEFHGDCSQTFPVGEVDEAAIRLINATKFSMEKGIQACHPGQHFRQIGAEVQAVADSTGFGINTLFCGHGIGKTFHQAPEIMHCRNNLPGIMQKNMTFTIEPILNESKWTDVVHHHDNWTVMTPDGSRSAQFEETIVITDSGADVMTKHKPGYFDKKM